MSNCPPGLGVLGSTQVPCTGYNIADNDFDPYVCVSGSMYVGDLVPDICIYIAVGATSTTRIRFRVQCPTATIGSIISVNPTGLLTTPLLQDSFDPTIYAFVANFTANADQIGQNLFVFRCS